MKHKLFTALLALLLVVSLVPAAAFADETENGTGAEAEEAAEIQEETEASGEAAKEEEPVGSEEPPEAPSGEGEADENPAVEAAAPAGGGEAAVASFESEETDVPVLGSAPSLTAVEGTPLTSTSGTLSSGSYYLESDITTNITIPAGAVVTIDLNGYTLTGKNGSPVNGSVITVNGTLTLTDSSEKGTGKITNGYALTGGGVFVKVDGSFTMNGGTITENTAINDGGGVHVTTDGSFTMNGGTITNNTAGNYGGGVSAGGTSCTFTMTGGTISGNTASLYGGGVYASGTSSITMNGGTISGNTAGYYGGGVYAGGSSSAFTMSGGIISGNTASSNGGGVYVSGSSSAFTMSGGTISGNTASSNGGGIYAIGTGSTITMTGGTVSGNQAKANGGGLYVSTSATVTVSGSPVITGNTGGEGAAAKTENVYLISGQYITLGGDLTSGASIGVTAQSASAGVQITTKESSTNYYSSSVSFFSSDNTSYVVRTNSSRYLELGTAITLTADMLTVNTDDETYTGSPITKSITSGLTEDTDYTVTYANNTNAGTATITITGKGSYTGELIYTFIINKADPAYTVPSGLTAIYGQTLDSVALPNGWAWKDAGTTSVGSVGTNTFSAIYTPDDTANYNTVTTDLTVTVSAIELTKDMFEVDTDDETYTGSAIAKSITSSLVEDTDYTVAYGGNTNAGTATITITGKGSYAGELIYKFIINKADQDIALESSAVTKTYGDAPFSNTVTGAVTGQFGYSSWKPEVATVDDNGVVTIVGAGTTNIAVFAWGDSNYNTAGKIYTLTVEQAVPVVSLSDVIVSKTYDGKPVNDPTVSVTLVNGDTDYTQTISYYDAAGNLLDSAPSAVGSYKVVATIDAGSNYSIATAEASFTILAAEQTVVIDGFTNVPYDGTPHEVTVTAVEDAAVTVIYTDADGNTVAAPVEAGAYTAHVTVTRTGYTTVEQDVAVSITTAAQAISYATAAVTKTEGDASFTNVLTQITVFGAITYASSDTSVAVVDDSGKVTIVGAGTAAITASVSGSDSYTAATAAYTLTVNPAADENTVDKSALQAAYDSSLGMTEGDYTAASWAVLTSVQEAAKAVLDDDAATQEEVDSALAALNAAIAALKSEPAGTPAAIAAPDTGDGNTPALWLGMTLLCAGALAVTAVVKKKRD